MSETSNGIRIVAAIGSVRPGNQTAKALALAVDEMRKHDGIEVGVIDPGEAAMSLREPRKTRLSCNRFKQRSRRRRAGFWRRRNTMEATAA